ncbi:MAG TPA: ATP-binding protein [Candidatus Acidoferrales bacterium]|jgi:signal transduction histidine kinase|nr:ATP-binding protein [Candidatus Acidoferrales bacterium]
MINGILILFLVLGFVLGCLGAGLYGRRLRARARSPLELRYHQLRFVLWVFAGLFVLLAFLAFQRPGPSSAAKTLFPVSFALCFGIVLWLFLRARKKMREQPESARPEKPSPTFFWQGVMILLPVAVLAVVSLVSLQQDERAAEAGARARAVQNAQSLARAIRVSVDEELHRYVSLQNVWGLGLYAISQSTVSGYDFPDAKLRADIEKWERDYPGLKLAQLAPKSGILMADGRQVGPPDFLAAPEPPKWFRELSPDQVKLWEALRAARNPRERDDRWQAFRASNPSPEAGLAAQMLTSPPEQIVQNTEAFPSETGIPFEEIACFQLLLATNVQPTDSLFQSVWYRAFNHPSILTPRLLDLAEGLTNRATIGQQQKVYWMRQLWITRSQTAEAFDSLRQLPDLRPWKKLWWSHWAKGDEMLAIFQPMTYLNGQDDSNSGQGYEVFLVPRTVVAAIFNRALLENKFLIPEYASPTLKVEGVPLPALQAIPVLGTKDVLGEAGETAGNYFAQNAIRFELKFFLTGREQMLSAERRRTKLFALLILGTVLTALAGLLAARRAFHRQLQLNDLKSNFVSSVSHELRAPIASVRLMAENLERGKIPDPVRQGEYFHFIVQECRRLSSLIENVLDFSRIEQGRKQYEFEPTNLVALTETTVKLMEPYAAEKGVNLKLETSSAPAGTANLELDIDGRAIQQALVNLIDNAVKHSPKSETVTVEIKNLDGADAIHLSVADHGPGIPAAEHEKIFERFYRLGSELRRETQGVGIGLSVVKHIVEAHHGRVVVESEIGKGSRFTIELPVKK